MGSTTHIHTHPNPEHTPAPSHPLLLLTLQVLVETVMLSAVSGLAFLVSTLLKLDNSLGYLLPLPPNPSTQAHKHKSSS
jgi:hypothetical protein